MPSLHSASPRVSTDIAKLPHTIRQTLNSQGYVHVRQPLSLETFRLVARHLGTIESETDVRIDPERQKAQEQDRHMRHARPGVYQAEALNLHTDSPRNDVLAWYCVSQDTADGTSLLLDLSDISEHFSPRERSVLNSIRLWYTARHPETYAESFFQQPLLVTEGSRDLVYYVPWLLSDDYNQAQSQVLQKFNTYLTHQQQTSLIGIRLAPEESLFIDNRRLLHGREGIAKHSARHLIRLYIRTPQAFNTNTSATGHEEA